MNLAYLDQGALSDNYYPNINRGDTLHFDLIAQTNAPAITTPIAPIHNTSPLVIETFDS